jgi:hypothetical protein
MADVVEGRGLDQMLEADLGILWSYDGSHLGEMATDSKTG